MSGVDARYGGLRGITAQGPGVGAWLRGSVTSQRGVSGVGAQYQGCVMSQYGVSGVGAQYQGFYDITASSVSTRCRVFRDVTVWGVQFRCSVMGFRDITARGSGVGTWLKGSVMSQCVGEGGSDFAMAAGCRDTDTNVPIPHGGWGLLFVVGSSWEKLFSGSCE